MRSIDERGSSADRRAWGLATVAVLICVAVTCHAGPRLPESIDEAKRAACRDNLSHIYAGLLEYQERLGHLPEGSGARFLGALIADGVGQDPVVNARRLTCPGVRSKALACGDLDPSEWFAALERVDGGYTAYAARNQRDFPLRELPGRPDEPLIACDNDPGMNHRGVTHVLMADGSVVSLEDQELVVGPDSPIEWLRELSLD